MKKNRMLRFSCLLIIASVVLSTVMYRQYYSFLNNPQRSRDTQFNYQQEDVSLRMYVAESDEHQALIDEASKQLFVSYQKMIQEGSYRLEGEIKEISTSLMVLSYTVFQEGIEEVRYAGYLIDVEQNKVMLLSDLLEERAIDRIVNEYLYQKEVQEGSKSSLELLEETMNYNHYFSYFFIANDQLVFLLDHKNWAFPLAELSEYFKIKIDCQQGVLSEFRYYIDQSKPMIALTFDDGPHESITLDIVETLSNYNSTATFYVVGNRIDDHQEVLKRVSFYGHSVGNHSWSHPYMTFYSIDKIQEEYQATDDKIESVINEEAQTIRPPYGIVTKKSLNATDKLFVMWSVDSTDWLLKDAKLISDKVVSEVQEGDIVLLHDIHYETAQAMEVLIPKLIEMGYQLVTIEELMESYNIEGEVYRGTK
ncbi:MAG: polysaccharide deacetylase family protein [Anaerorhabdus sp.]